MDVDFALEDNGTGIITDDMQYLKQEINILFDTRRGDLLGDVEYGTDYMHFLYDLKATAAAMEYQMMLDLYKLDLKQFSPTCNVYLMKGTERDIAIIEVNLDRYDEHTTELYKIT